jgi:SAM-dependent methyltransferase
MTAAETYAARVDAVLAQRTRLRGPQPPGDPLGGLWAEHPMVKSDARRPLDTNLGIIANYVQPTDVIVDVGGGGGRLSLPLALRCREVINVDPSAVMLRGFEANASRAGIGNARAVHADWLHAEPPKGTLALVNHVTYMTRDIVPFIQKLEAAASRRVLITVNSPPPPSWNRELFRLVYGEEEAIVPGHIELVNVLWEMGIEPDIRMLPDSPPPPGPAATREAIVNIIVARFPGEQWANWPLGAELEGRLREMLETRFDDLFTQVTDGYVPAWITPGREVLITWESRR